MKSIPQLNVSPLLVNKFVLWRTRTVELPQTTIVARAKLPIFIGAFLGMDKRAFLISLLLLLLLMT